MELHGFIPNAHVPNSLTVDRNLILLSDTSSGDVATGEKLPAFNFAPEYPWYRSFLLYSEDRNTGVLEVACSPQDLAVGLLHPERRSVSSLDVASPIRLTMSLTMAL